MRRRSLCVVFVGCDSSCTFIDLRRKGILPKTNQLPRQRQASSVEESRGVTHLHFGAA